MAATALKKITTRAKQIRKKHPGKSWKAAIKQAGAEYRGGKISGVRKKRVARKSPKKTARKRTARKVSGMPVMPSGSSIVAARRETKEKLGWAMATQATAKTKREKKAMGVKIAELKKKYKALL